MKRSRMPRSRRPLPAMSAKRRAELDARARCRAAVLERDGTCVFRRYVHAAPAEAIRRIQVQIPAYCDTLNPLEVHEIVRRSRGGDWLNPDECVALCRTHHRWVTHHDTAARAIGLSASRAP